MVMSNFYFLFLREKKREVDWKRRKQERKREMQEITDAYRIEIIYFRSNLRSFFLSFSRSKVIKDERL